MMSHLVSAKWKARSLGNVIPSSRVDCAAPPCRLLLLFTLAIARLIGITNAATTHTIDEVCHDDPAFVDAAGYPCTAWRQYDCTSTTIRHEGVLYRVSDMQSVRRHCPVSCNLCKMVDGGLCADDQGFVDAIGNTCGAWRTYDCSSAARLVIGLVTDDTEKGAAIVRMAGADGIELERRCPVSCGLCRGDMSPAEWIRRRLRTAAWQATVKHGQSAAGFLYKTAAEAIVEATSGTVDEALLNFLSAGGMYEAAGAEHGDAALESYVRAIAVAPNRAVGHVLLGKLMQKQH